MMRLTRRQRWRRSTRPFRWYVVALPFARCVEEEIVGRALPFNLSATYACVTHALQCLLFYGEGALPSLQRVKRAAGRLSGASAPKKRPTGLDDRVRKVLATSDLDSWCVAPPDMR